MADAEAAIANAQKLADQFAQGSEGVGTETPATENGDSQNNKRKLETDGTEEEDGTRKKTSFNGPQSDLVRIACASTSMTLAFFDTICQTESKTTHKTLRNLTIIPVEGCSSGCLPRAQTILSSIRAFRRVTASQMRSGMLAYNAGSRCGYERLSEVILKCRNQHLLPRRLQRRQRQRQRQRQQQNLRQLLQQARPS